METRRRELPRISMLVPGSSMAGPSSSREAPRRTDPGLLAIALLLNMYWSRLVHTFSALEPFSFALTAGFVWDGSVLRPLVTCWDRETSVVP